MRTSLAAILLFATAATVEAADISVILNNYMEKELLKIRGVTRSHPDIDGWRLEMTRYKAEQQMHQALFSVEAIEKFYSYPPDLQSVVAPFFVDLLKTYEVKNADAYIVPGIQVLPPQPGAPAAGPQAIPPSRPASPPDRF